MLEGLRHENLLEHAEWHGRITGSPCCRVSSSSPVHRVGFSQFPTITMFPHLLPCTVLQLFTSKLLGSLSPNTMPSFYMGAGYSNPGPCVCRACVLIHRTISPALLCTIHYKWWFAFENLFFQFSVKGYFHCMCHFRWMGPFSFCCSLTCMAEMRRTLSLSFNASVFSGWF